MSTHNPFYTGSQLSRIIQEAHESLEIYEELWDLKKAHRKWDVKYRLLCTFPAGIEMEEINHAYDTCAEIDEKINKLKAYILTIRPYWLSDDEISRITEVSLNALEAPQLEKLHALVNMDVIYKQLESSRPLLTVITPLTLTQ